jgi:hypothetical protein
MQAARVLSRTSGSAGRSYVMAGGVVSDSGGADWRRGAGDAADSKMKPQPVLSLLTLGAYQGRRRLTNT